MENKDICLQKDFRGTGLEIDGRIRSERK